MYVTYSVSKSLPERLSSFSYSTLVLLAHFLRQHHAQGIGHARHPLVDGGMVVDHLSAPGPFPKVDSPSQRQESQALRWRFLPSAAARTNFLSIICCPVCPGAPSGIPHRQVGGLACAPRRRRRTRQPTGRIDVLRRLRIRIRSRRSSWDPSGPAEPAATSINPRCNQHYRHAIQIHHGAFLELLSSGRTNISDSG